MDLAVVLSHRYPDLAGWSVVNGELKDWPDGVEKPTQAELDATWIEVQAIRAIRDKADLLREGAGEKLRDYPDWAKWDIQTAQNYIDTNVTDLASAKFVLNKMVAMMFEMRDYVFALIVAEMREKQNNS